MTYADYIFILAVTLGAPLVFVALVALLELRRQPLSSVPAQSWRDTLSPRVIDTHQHVWVVVHVRGCAHEEPGPYCRQCGSKVDVIGLSCSDCGLAVQTTDGEPARYESDEKALESIRWVGLDVLRMSDDQLKATIREMAEAGYT